MLFAFLLFYKLFIFLVSFSPLNVPPYASRGEERRIRIHLPEPCLKAVRQKAQTEKRKISESNIIKI